MSLVVALAKSKEAVIGGDRRSITFLGSCPELEQDLYSGLIKDDEALLARAKEAGATLQVADGRDKVWRRGDILVGRLQRSPLNLIGAGGSMSPLGPICRSRSPEMRSESKIEEWRGASFMATASPSRSQYRLLFRPAAGWMRLWFERSSRRQESRLPLSAGSM